MTELLTQRLLLRPARMDDAPCFALGVGEHEVARWLTPLPWPYSLAMAQDWLRQAQPPTPEKCLFIIERPGQGLIGCISLISELGFWIARPHWGRGYAGEAAVAVIDWHFAGCDADAISSSAHHNNLASLRVLAKLGFGEHGREMRFSQTLQRNVQHVLTRLTRADWPKREGRECA